VAPPPVKKVVAADGSAILGISAAELDEAIDWPD
jgi:hypothetical protein